MSHTTVTDVKFQSKGALREMCRLFPEQFTFHDEQSFQFFAGRREPCDFCLSVAGSSYQVGFREQEDGGLVAVVDWWKTGRMDQLLGGEDMKILKAHYAVGLASSEAKASGFLTEVDRLQDGSFKVFAFTKEEYAKHGHSWNTQKKSLLGKAWDGVKNIIKIGG
jgi:hypothetical protein